MITSIACHKATDEHHALSFVYKNEKYEYHLETPMLMEFGLIHCCGAVQRLIQDTSFFYEDREIQAAADRESEALEACAQAITAKKRQGNIE